MGALILNVVVLLLSAPAWGQEMIFADDFESGDTSGWWAPARVEKTGQVTCYDAGGVEIPCAGTGQDGDLRPGVAWPSPRFVINGDGTVTDKLTGLVWLRHASCFGHRTWVEALGDAAGLASGSCGLTDGSAAGDWRLPSVTELLSLVDYQYAAPSISNSAGTGQCTSGDPFYGLIWDYWTSSSFAIDRSYAWEVNMAAGYAFERDKVAFPILVWPVRNGR